MHKRITLINSADGARDWRAERDSPSRLAFGTFLTVLRHTTANGLRQVHDDIERVILDRTATPANFLQLLAHLSDDFAGDIVFIGEGDGGYLSAIGRGGSRVLYALSADDLRFYLETHQLFESRSVAAA